jgi:hypothetical protein
MTKRTEAEHQQMADWAENDMDFDPEAPGVLYGAEAAAAGQAAIARALGGRPSIDPAAGPGQHSRNRTVRLPAELEKQLLELAARQNRRPSDVMRDAVGEYLQSHPVTA